MATFDFPRILSILKDRVVTDDGHAQFPATDLSLVMIVRSMHEQRAATIDVEMPTLKHDRELTEEEKAGVAISRARKEFIINADTWHRDGYFIISVDDHQLLMDSIKNGPQDVAQKR